VSFSQQGAALTIAQREAQGRNAIAIAILVARAFGLVVSPVDLTGTFRAFLDLVIQAIFTSRRRSVTLAGQYLTNYRVVELAALQVAGEIDGSWHGELFVPSPADDLLIEQLRVSLVATGPAAYTKALHNGVDPDAAWSSAQTQIGAAAAKHVLNGGRTAVINTSQSDPRALGYARILRSDNPCYFCAMLASRGPVFQDDSFDLSDPRFVGPGDVKVHDHCACSMEPVYTRNADWPSNGRELGDLWQTSTKGHSGPAAIRAFRRAYEAMLAGDHE
jgi:hypothetical protein